MLLPSGRAKLKRPSGPLKEWVGVEWGSGFVASCRTAAEGRGQWPDVKMQYGFFRSPSLRLVHAPNPQRLGRLGTPNKISIASRYVGCTDPHRIPSHEWPFHLLSFFDPQRPRGAPEPRQSSPSRRAMTDCTDSRPTPSHKRPFRFEKVVYVSDSGEKRCNSRFTTRRS